MLEFFHPLRTLHFFFFFNVEQRKLYLQIYFTDFENLLKKKHLILFRSHLTENWGKSEKFPFWESLVPDIHSKYFRGIYRKVLLPFCTFYLAHFSLSVLEPLCSSFPFSSSTALNIYIVIQLYFRIAIKVHFFQVIIEDWSSFSTYPGIKMLQCVWCKILLISLGDRCKLSHFKQNSGMHLIAKTLGVRLAMSLHFKTNSF